MEGEIDIESKRIWEKARKRGVEKERIWESKANKKERERWRKREYERVRQIKKKES